MTKEDSLRPPRLATWLLEQFSPVVQNAPLTGDLLEAFKQGRSAGWYWRQVSVAILLAVPNFLWKQFGCLAYAGCCSRVIAIAWRFWSLNMEPLQLSALYRKGYEMQWPWSVVYFASFDIALHTAFQSVMVSAALCVYLALFRSLTPRNLGRALPVVIVVLASANAVWMFLSYILVPGLRITWWGPFSTVTVAVLLGMWKSNIGGTLRPKSA